MVTMAGVDGLVRARAEFEAGEWAEALDRWSRLDAGSLGAEDLADAAQSAYLLGRTEESAELYRRAHEERLDAGDVEGAVRCAFHISMNSALAGDLSAASGWASRGERLLGRLPPGSLEAGYLAFARMFLHLRAGRMQQALECAVTATETGRRFADAELAAMGLCSQGRLSIYSGDVPGGLAMLDESMVEATTAVRDLVSLGHVYCTAIEGCQEIAEIGRVAEWTELLHRWCGAHPQLVIFVGQCSLHRAQVLRARGAWPEALDELDAAIRRYERSGALVAVGQAAYERGDLLRLRGETDAASESFRMSAERGYDPQPGLAEMWLDQGSTAAAAGAVHRLLEETRGDVARSRVLPGAVRVLVGAGEVDSAVAAARELEALSESFGCEALELEAALAAAEALRSSGDVLGCMPYLRKARQLATRLDLPFHAARARLAAARALRALGDEETARTELDAARAALGEIGARADLAGVGATPSPTLPRGLSDREVEVLRLVAAGRSNAEIAAELVLSERTVARHVSNIFVKLDVGSRTAAAAFAYENGLVGGSRGAVRPPGPG
jgi:DNA-binding CsgD family transcriptional regulator